MTLERFDTRSRPAIFGRLEADRFDLLVVGGGITGASIFRDAVLRGLRVALVEARDFASATSGRSSQLIHGGLRYLKNLGLRLARESCRERNLHIRLNKRLVRPLPFLVPIYQRDSRLALRAGMLLYELLSAFGNHRVHRFLTREETLSRAPGLQAEGLTGGCLYYDAVVSDSRWTIEILKDGVRHGGLALNYAPVVALRTGAGGISGAIVADQMAGGTYEIAARAVVNATGVFSDAIRRMDRPDVPRLVHLSKGTHLVFAAEDVPLDVTTVFRSPVDGRALFLVQRDGCFLYGTTDDWVDGEPDEPRPQAKDVEYLLESLRRFMPEANLDRRKVRFAYSGFRPLLATGSGSAATDASREDYIEVSPSGLVSVVGGKLTTARLMAIRVLEGVRSRIGPSTGWSPCRTHERSIGGTNEAVAEGLAHWVKRCPELAGYFRILYQRYGLDAGGICSEAMEIGRAEPPEARLDPLLAEARYVCRHEMVCTVEDLIDRRAGFLYWDAEKRLERLRYGAEAIRAELDLSEAEFERQFAAYRDHLARFHSLPPEPAPST